jgi:hypothetical protein
MLYVLVILLTFPANEIINGFGGRLPSTSKSKVVHVPKEWNILTFICRTIDDLLSSI